MNKPCKCTKCGNMNCIINFHASAGYKIVDGYYRALDQPSWQDITEKMPEILECSDFVVKEETK